MAMVRLKSFCILRDLNDSGDAESNELDFGDAADHRVDGIAYVPVEPPTSRAKVLPLLHSCRIVPA